MNDTCEPLKNKRKSYNEEQYFSEEDISSAVIWLKRRINIYSISVTTDTVKELINQAFEDVS